MQRVFADRAIAHKLAERLAETAKALQVGDPTLPETEVGPMIRHSELQRVDQWVQEAVVDGAKLLCAPCVLALRHVRWRWRRRANRCIWLCDACVPYRDHLPWEHIFLDLFSFYLFSGVRFL